MNYKTWLFLLVFLSVYIILGIDLNYLPLIPSTSPPEKITKFNNVFLSIAYSILAAYIFFYFSVVLPRKVLIHRSKNIISKQVNWLLYELFVLINQILYSYDIEKDIENVHEKDLLHINGNVKGKLSGFYSTSEHWRTIGKRGKKFTGFGDMPFTFPDSVIANLKKIPEKIEQIRKSNPNFHIDETFSEILSSIETNQIIEWHTVKNYQMFKLANSSDEIYSLICDYKRLKKLKYHLRFRNSYNTIHFYNSEEINNIEQKHSELFERIAPIHKKFNTLKPSLLCNPDYEDYRAFKSVLRVSNIVNYKKQEDLDLSSPKCIIILSKGISRKYIKEFKRKYQKENLVIILRPNIFHTSKPDKFKNDKIDNGFYNLYYRAPLKVFNFTLFERYPSKGILETLSRNIHHLITNHK